MKRGKFWLVWREHGSAPTYKHQTKEDAVQEAERLAKLHPENVFFVMEAKAGRFSREPDVERVKVKGKLTSGDIPF